MIACQINFTDDMVMTGCGITMSGWSCEEVAAKWNRRAPQSPPEEQP